MNNSYLDCKHKLEQLREWYDKRVGKQDFNEAKTRQTLIDTLFYECLGWEKKDVAVEERIQDVGFADYVFSDQLPHMVIEAKREGKHFNIPKDFNRLEAPISALTQHNKDIKEALGQVANYCQSNGVVIGGIANGHQLILIIASRMDGTRPLEGRALVFESLTSMEKNFDLLWDCCSKAGIKAQYLRDKLLQDSSPVLPAKLSASIYNYPGLKNRNSVQAEQQTLTDLILEDLIKSQDEKTFLKACYCSSGALSQYSLLSRDILNQRYVPTDEMPNLFKANTKDGISEDILHGALSRRPVLLIGDAGVGKTSFIKNLIYVEAESYFKKNIALYLDLGSNAVLSLNIRQAVMHQIRSILKDEYGLDINQGTFIRSVYDQEIQEFQNGIFGTIKESDPAAYHQREIEHLASLSGIEDQHISRSIAYIQDRMHKQVAIFIDNTDQRSPEDQQLAFLIAQEVAENWKLNAFVSLRPETYHSSMRTGALSGYHTKAFTISPPRVDEVLDKRLSFGIKIASGEERLSSLSEGISVALDKVTILLEVFRLSLTRNKELVQFIDNLSYGNIRKALEMVRSFFGSGHINTAKIIDIYAKDSRYVIPLHEFLRAIIYGDHNYYHPDRSPLTNIFDLRYPIGRDHFTLPTLISLLHSLSKSSKDGFVEVPILLGQMQTLGYSVDEAQKALDKALEDKLVEAKFIEAKLHSYRATAAGLYHVEILPRNFSYIDAITVDTPILHALTATMLKDVHSIDDRLIRADNFIEYLNEEWKKLKTDHNPFGWQQIYHYLRADIVRVQRKLQLKRLQAIDDGEPNP